MVKPGWSKISIIKRVVAVGATMATVIHTGDITLGKQQIALVQQDGDYLLSQILKNYWICTTTKMKLTQT